MKKVERYTIEELGIDVDLYETASGQLAGSVVIERDDKYNEEFTGEYMTSIDALSSFLLALACEGVDLRDEKIKKALQVTIDAICYQL